MIIIILILGALLFGIGVFALIKMTIDNPNIIKWIICAIFVIIWIAYIGYMFNEILKL